MPQRHWSNERDWGPWHLDRRACLLWTEAGGYRYEVDLRECTTSAGLLDWICQINGKSWGDTRREHERLVAGFVEALRDILKPQSNLCSGGASHTIAFPALRKLISETRTP